MRASVFLVPLLALSLGCRPDDVDGAGDTGAESRDPQVGVVDERDQLRFGQGDAVGDVEFWWRNVLTDELPDLGVTGRP